MGILMLKSHQKYTPHLCIVVLDYALKKPLVVSETVVLTRFHWLRTPLSHSTP
jgi:hypothetical protein